MKRLKCNENEYDNNNDKQKNKLSISMSQWNSLRHEFQPYLNHSFWWLYFIIFWLVLLNFLQKRSEYKQKQLRFLIFRSPPDAIIFTSNCVCTLTNYLLHTNLAQIWNYYSKRKIHCSVQLLFALAVRLSFIRFFSGFYFRYVE